MADDAPDRELKSFEVGRDVWLEGLEDDRGRSIATPIASNLPEWIFKRWDPAKLAMGNSRVPKCIICAETSLGALMRRSGPFLPPISGAAVCEQDTCRTAAKAAVLMHVPGSVPNA